MARPAGSVMMVVVAAMAVVATKKCTETPAPHDPSTPTSCQAFTATNSVPTKDCLMMTTEDDHLYFSFRPEQSFTLMEILLKVIASNQYGTVLKLDNRTLSDPSAWYLIEINTEEKYSNSKVRKVYSLYVDGHMKSPKESHIDEELFFSVYVRGSASYAPDCDLSSLPTRQVRPLPSPTPPQSSHPVRDGKTPQPETVSSLVVVVTCSVIAGVVLVVVVAVVVVRAVASRRSNANAQRGDTRAAEFHSQQQHRDAGEDQEPEHIYEEVEDHLFGPGTCTKRRGSANMSINSLYVPFEETIVS